MKRTPPPAAKLPGVVLLSRGGVCPGRDMAATQKYRVIRRGEHCSPAAATPVNQPDGQTPRASNARPYTQRDNSNKLLVARRGGVTPPYGAIKLYRAVGAGHAPPAVLRLQQHYGSSVGAAYMPPVAATPAMQYNGQTPRDAYMRPLQTCRQICTTRKTAGRAIKFIAPRFYGKTKTRRPLPRLVFHKKKEKNRTSCRFLQRNGTHPSTSRCPSFRPGRALWYSSSLSNHGDVFCPRVIFRCLHSTRFLSELQEVAVYNVL